MIIKRYYTVAEIAETVKSSRKTILTIIEIFKIPLNKSNGMNAVDVSFYDTILDLRALNMKSGMRYDFIKKLSKTQITELLEL